MEILKFPAKNDSFPLACETCGHGLFVIVVNGHGLEAQCDCCGEPFDMAVEDGQDDSQA